MAHMAGKKDAVGKLCHSLQVNVEKAQKVLQWQPAFSVNEELKQTIKWYKNEYKNNWPEAITQPIDTEPKQAVVKNPGSRRCQVIGFINKAVRVKL